LIEVLSLLGFRIYFE